MNFKSQICTTKEQSERLLALGLRKETADCAWNVVTLYNTPITFSSQESWLNYSSISDNHFPAWSLPRLLEMMPIYIDVAGNEWTLNILQGKLVAYTNDENNDFLFAQGAISLYDSIIAAIEWCIQTEHFNKEYLSEV